MAYYRPENLSFITFVRNHKGFEKADSPCCPKCRSADIKNKQWSAQVNKRVFEVSFICEECGYSYKRKVKLECNSQKRKPGRPRKNSV